MKKTILLIILSGCVMRTLTAQHNVFLRPDAEDEKILSGCTMPVAISDLDIANVRAKLLTGGDMWWDMANAGYEVPKGSGKTSIFEGGLWIGGIDAGGQIRVAAETYRQTGQDFWPGPINPATVDVDPATCATYDRIWKLNKSEVQDFVNSGSTTVQDIIDYPGNNPYTAGTPMAPYYDANGDGMYNYAAGDYPYFNIGSGLPDCCSQLHGDQCLWWVINDVGDVHTVTNSQPLGIEIQCQAYAFDTIHPETAYSTFYQYTLINRSGNTYYNTYFGQWVDPDLGDYSDDYVGCDVIKGVGYCYNGDPDDGTVWGYGINPPAIGVDFLRGPLADPGDGIDNNYNGIVDEPDEDITMSNFLRYSYNFSVPDGDPLPYSYSGYYNYLKSIWLDGLPLTHSCDGRDQSAPTSHYMFPGNLHGGSTDPYFTDDLNESTCGNAPGDRRFIISAGQFTLDPGEVNCISVGVVWAKATSGGPIASVDLMLSTDSVIQVLFDSCFAAFRTGIHEISVQENITIAPNPFSHATTIKFNNPQGISYSLQVYDMRGILVKNITDIKNNFVTIEKESLSNGMYFFKLTSENRHSSSGRLVIE